MYTVQDNRINIRVPTSTGIPGKVFSSQEKFWQLGKSQRILGESGKKNFREIGEKSGNSLSGKKSEPCNL